MELIKPSYQILTPIDGDAILQSLELAARTCYKSEDRITKDSAPKFCKMLLNRNHESTIEHIAVTVKFIINRGCCYDKETEVLTKDGWKYFKDVKITDNIACLSNNEKLYYSKPKKIYKYKYTDDLLHFHSSSIDLLVTPNHNMWVFDYNKRTPQTKIWKFIRADKLTNGRYKFKKNAKWNGQRINLTIDSHPTQFNKFPKIILSPEQSDDLLELLGFWITDGSYRYGNANGSGSYLQISQSKPKGVERIKYLCDRLNFSYSNYKKEIRIGNLQLVRFVESLFHSGAKTFTAFVPQIIKDANSNQISRFLDGVIGGDGNIHSTNNHRVIYTASKQFADDLQELILKIGLSSSIRIDDRIGEKHIINEVEIETKNICYIVSIHEEKRSVHLLDRRNAKSFGNKIPYDDYVYCLEVPDHRLLVRRNGKICWCGNSHELVRHRLASFSQESTRYVSYNKKGMQFIIPPWTKLKEGKYRLVKRSIFGATLNPPAIEYRNKKNLVEEQQLDKSTHIFLFNLLTAEDGYNNLLKQGWKPQEAREVLPNALKTEIVMTANLREWRHIFKLRTAKAAHPQMQEIMRPLLDEFKQRIPVIFDDIIYDS